VKDSGVRRVFGGQVQADYTKPRRNSKRKRVLSCIADRFRAHWFEFILPRIFSLLR